MKVRKRAHTAEFRTLALQRVQRGQTVGALGSDLGLVEQTLRNWVRATAAGTLNSAGAQVVTPEQMEFSRRRGENIRLQRESEILKNATTYLAKDAL